MRVWFAIAMLMLTPAWAGEPRVKTDPRIVKTAPPKEQSVFQVTCTDVMRIVGGSSFSFKCLKEDGSSVMLTAVKTYDNTGEYSVGFEDSTSAALTNLYAMTAIATAVSTFAAIKAADPGSKAVLEASCMYSKLVISKDQAVVTTATLIIK